MSGRNSLRLFKRKSIMRHLASFVLTVAVLVGAVVPVAYAELGRVGPVGAAFGYPDWYQDKTGVAFEFCSPLNQAELDGGWCLLLAGDTTAPEVFPTSFFDERFYWAAGNAPGTFANGGAVRLVMALEGAFSVGPVVPGDQITFGRIRIDARNLPVSGNYRVETPFVNWDFPNMTAGDRLFFTEDIGIACSPGQFDCALATSIGPFLVPSNTPGGPEIAPITGPVAGKLYVADPARIGPVTGSPIGQNFFRVSANGVVLYETSDFSLMGRLMAGPIAGRIAVDRASYALTPTIKKLDVFATGQPTTQGRLPGTTAPPAIQPGLSFFDVPCGVDALTNNLIAPVGGIETQMAVNGNTYWGQTQPTTIPLEVCVKDSNGRNAAGQVVPAYFKGVVTDEITISQATYNPNNGGSLTVSATSSDVVTPTILTLAGFGDLTTGQITVPSLAAPPARVRVNSTNLGTNDYQVTSTLNTTPSATKPLAVNDAVTTNEDTPVTIAVLANDTVNGGPIPAGSTVTITAVPQLGTAVVNADGTIGYTPNLNASGADGLSYTVTVAGQTSTAASVTITITPVNDVPTAVNDTTQAVVNVSTTINLLTNDTDPDGQADLATVQIVTPPAAGATATVVAGTGNVTFTATVAGVYTFTYRAVDRAGALSANTATVTVTVAGAEAIQNMTATYRLGQARWIVSGTDTLPAGQTITIAYANGTASGTVIGTAVVGANGSWLLDLRGVTGNLNPRNVGATQVRATSSLSNATAIANITIRQ
jgi:hypothetical protein